MNTGTGVKSMGPSKNNSVRSKERKGWDKNKASFNTNNESLYMSMKNSSMTNNKKLIKDKSSMMTKHRPATGKNSTLGDRETFPLPAGSSSFFTKN